MNEYFVHERKESRRTKIYIDKKKLCECSRIRRGRNDLRFCTSIHNIAQSFFIKAPYMECILNKITQEFRCFQDVTSSCILCKCIYDTTPTLFHAFSLFQFLLLSFFPTFHSFLQSLSFPFLSYSN